MFFSSKCTSLLQQTSTGKLPTFFLRFETEVSTLKVNETKITSGNAFNLDHFETAGNHELRNDQKSLIWYFCRIATTGLIVRTLKTYIYFFRDFVKFYISKTLSVIFPVSNFCAFA